MKVSKIKEIVSYFMPIHVEACSSFHNPLLEVTLRNRRYVLDAKDSNYSFGALYTIFKNVFDELSIKERNINSCLLMGPCDTGSIVTTVTGAIIGKMSRVLAVGGIEIEVEPSVYEHYQKQGWKDAY
jgi:hypothetical protein